MVRLRRVIVVHCVIPSHIHLFFPLFFSIITFRVVATYTYKRNAYTFGLCLQNVRVEPIGIGYRLYIAIIKALSGNERSE